MAPNTKVEVPDFPKKLFYKINEVASITGVEAYVLRYWEGKFPMLAPEKDENDQRRYRQKDIEMLFYIKKLLYENKYTIAGAVEVLKQEKPGRKKKGRKGEEEPAEIETSSDGSDSEAVKGDAEGDEGPGGVAAATSGPSVDPERLARMRKQVGSIRKNVKSLVVELREWRDSVGSGS